MYFEQSLFIDSIAAEERVERGPPEWSREARKGDQNGQDGHMQIQGARLVRVS